MANECRNLAENVANGRLTADELKTLMDRLETKRRKAETELADLEAVMFKEGRAILGEVEAAAKIERRNALRNIIRRSALQDKILRADEMTGDPSLGIAAALVGANSPFTGAGKSVQATVSGYINKWSGGFLHDVKKAGVLADFQGMKGELEEQVAKVLYDMNLPEPTGVEASETARTIAKFIKKYQDAAKDTQNSFGAYIRDRAGYIVRQTHDVFKMGRAGRDAWKAFVRERLDFDRMEIAPERVEDFLQSAWESITSGVRIVDEATPVEKAFKGPGNLGKRVSASRVMVFKDAKVELEYLRQFGDGNIREGFYAGLHNAARASGLMSELGPNPKAMLETLSQWAQERYRADPKKLDKLRSSWINNWENQLAELTGEVNAAPATLAGRTMQTVGAASRIQQTVSKLGGAAISQLATDWAYMTVNRRYQGRSFLDALGDSFSAYAKGFEGGERRDFGMLIGVGIDGYIGETFSRLEAQDTLTGTMGRLQQLFFKLNMQQPLNDASRRGITRIFSADLGLKAKMPFDALDADMKRVLGLYEIGPREWEVARRGVRRGDDGVDYLLPGDVQDVTGDVFTGMSRPQQERFKAKVSEALFAMFANEADYSIPTPGARERAVMRMGQKSGTVLGEALRFFWQFKSFGVVALTKPLGRAAYGYTGKMDTAANVRLASQIALLTIGGYYGLQAKELIKGREMRPNTLKTAMAAAMQGGGLGIYGDFLFGEASRVGGGPLETFMGPTYGTTSQALQTALKIRDIPLTGDSDARGDMLRLAQGNVPFGNLFYVKPALDYMIWYQMQEMLNPGYLRRMERRIERENNQQFWLPPSSVVATGGGFR